LPADVCGDDRPEVIVYTDSSAEIFHHDDCDPEDAVTGSPRAQTKRLYNWTRYWGGQYP
jgi:hypothetical protein